MSTPTPLRIQTVTGEGKGRSFSGVVLAIAASKTLWSLGGNGESVRPLMMIVAASAQELRPLIENLRAGMKAVLSGHTLSGDGVAVEFMRSAGYGWSPPQPLPAEDAAIVHITHPSLFAFVPPSLDESQVSFVVMPSTEDIAEAVTLHKAEIEDALSHARTLGYQPRDLVQIGLTPTFAGLAAIWASHLQRRTIWAVPQRLAFRVQLLLACMKQGIVTMGDRELRTHHVFARPWWNAGLVDFESVVHPKLGMHPGLATMAKGDFLADVLVREVGLFDAMRRGKAPGKAAA